VNCASLRIIYFGCGSIPELPKHPHPGDQLFTDPDPTWSFFEPIVKKATGVPVVVNSDKTLN
jgi:hypothetical protein